MAAAFARAQRGNAPCHAGLRFPGRSWSLLAFERRSSAVWPWACLRPCPARRPRGGRAARARGTRGSPATNPCPRVRRGYSPTAAAGIVGNLGQESRFNSGIVGDNGTSGGLAQWHGERLQDLEQYAIAQGKDCRDPQVQLDFLDKEVRQNPQLFAALNSAKSPAPAAAVFIGGFERPAAASANAARREAIAQSVDSGTQFASLGDSDATAYATPETPAVPPVSAAAGRHNPARRRIDRGRSFWRPVPEAESSSPAIGCE